MDLIKAYKKDQALKDEILTTQKNKDGFRLWWLGQSGYLLQWKGIHLLIDPYLSDSLTKKYADSDKPHIRMSERVIAPEELDFIHLATSSHNHTDHLDGETLIPIIAQNPGLRMIIPEANRSFVAQRIQQPEDYPIGMEAQMSIEIDDIWIHGIPAAHEEIEKDAQDRHIYMGYVFEFGPWTIYHSGDTVWFPELPQYLEPFNINLAILPINGRAPERKVAGNMNAREAVQLAQAIKADIVLPCHYDMFTFNTADPKEFASIAESENQKYLILQHGEHLTERVFL
ncbi:MAG: MBL fold metallo-hydrolase [Bacteroidetes bacterium]|nr:MBL fold metallo-hydrolase [Bacteroidota bacterium]